jgi:hypothetical protein
MRYEKPKYEFPFDWQDWCTGAGQPAGIWWLDGRTFFAGFGSLAEARLAEAGAFQVATLQFESDVLESSPPGRTVDPVRPDLLLRLLGQAVSERVLPERRPAA